VEEKVWWGGRGREKEKGGTLNTFYRDLDQRGGRKGSWGKGGKKRSPPLLAFSNPLFLEHATCKEKKKKPRGGVRWRLRH